MANKSSEHRMLFDIRGKRKRVVQVVYALLAVLMGLSLFTVVGPSAGFLGDIFGTSSSTNVASVYDDQAAKLQAKLRKNPKDEQALIQLTRTRFYAAQSLATQAQQSGSSVPTAALDEVRKSADAWSRYIQLHPSHPPPLVASLAAKSFSVLAGSATTATDFRQNAKQAAAAQKIATGAKPTVSNLFALAQAEYLAFDYAAGDSASNQAVQKTPGAQRTAVKQQLASAKKQAKATEKRVATAAKAEAQQGKQQLQQGGAGGLAGGGSGLSGGGLSGAP
jgi:hypothetical protein